MPGPLAAQEPRPFEPRVELGLSGVFLGGFVDITDFVGGVQSPLAGPGVSIRVNIWERVALEVSGAFDHVEDAALQFYQASVVIKQRARQPGRWFQYIRLGAGGRHEFMSAGESRRENQDYSITVFPAYERHKLTGLNYFVAGAGFQRSVSPRLAFTAELDGVVGAIGVGLRASAGVVIPLGSYKSR